MSTRVFPAWCVEAFETAKQLRENANALWEKHIGPLRPFDGFHVRPHPIGKTVYFISLLYGGRWYVGTADAVAEAQLSYISSRAKRRKEAA